MSLPSSTGAPLPQSTLITTELAGLDPSRPSVRRAHQDRCNILAQSTNHVRPPNRTARLASSQVAQSAESSQGTWTAEVEAEADDEVWRGRRPFCHSRLSRVPVSHYTSRYVLRELSSGSSAARPRRPAASWNFPVRRANAWSWPVGVSALQIRSQRAEDHRDGAPLTP